jgi:hypothetical protein
MAPPSRRRIGAGSIELRKPGAAVLIRTARPGDLEAIVALLADDPPGSRRETRRPAARSLSAGFRGDPQQPNRAAAGGGAAGSGRGLSAAVLTAESDVRRPAVRPGEGRAYRAGAPWGGYRTLHDRDSVGQGPLGRLPRHPADHQPAATRGATFPREPGTRRFARWTEALPARLTTGSRPAAAGYRRKITGGATT